MHTENSEIRPGAEFGRDEPDARDAGVDDHAGEPTVVEAGAMHPADEPPAPEGEPTLLVDAPAPAATRNGARRGWLLFIVVLGIAAGLRFVNLDKPYEVYFDETYYANDAVVYLEGRQAFIDTLDAQYGGSSRETEAVPIAGVDGEISWVHPPLGKWLIAAGIATFGKNPWGWRIPGALFGVGMVAIVYLMALVLWRSHAWAAVASSVVAFDGLGIVQSRIATLDIFAATFIALAFLMVLLDRRAAERYRDRRDEADIAAWQARVAAWEQGLPEPEPDSLPRAPRRRLWIGSGWRLATGLALAAAVATKWTGAYAIAVAVFLALVWSATMTHPGNRIREVIWNLPSIAICLILLPAVLYVVSFAGWFLNPGPDAPSILADPGQSISRWYKVQKDTLHYHRSLDTPHPYQSSPGGWPLMNRPIAYWYEDFDNGERGHIVAVGNPFVWWPFIALAPVVIAFAIARRDWRDWFIIAGYLGLYLPWFLSTRTAFFYYMTPLIPLIALGVTSAARRAPKWLWPASGLAVAAAALVGCWLFYPIWTGMPLEYAPWQDLMLFQSWI